MVIGSGPIIIGQAAEFDYAGTQACRALREEGVSVVLINSNPATIMTDIEMADRVYIEPLNVEFADARHRARAARRPAAHAGRADGPEPRHAAGRGRAFSKSTTSACWERRSPSSGRRKTARSSAI